MIGVIVATSQRDLAAEFFELLKTPWEYWRSEGCYDVVLSTSGTLPSGQYALSVIFSGEKTAFDCALAVDCVPASSGGVVISPEGEMLPIYGSLQTFANRPAPFLREETTQAAAAYAVESESGTVLRIGYDLFTELHYLLARGQPAQFAAIPTLDRHIDWLRDWITRSGLPLVEIPPVPVGYSFIACLTHDIDHPSLRHHRWDHSMWGFLYRATVGTILEVCRGRRTLPVLWKNLWAVCTLPLVHLGWVRDSWAQFPRYSEIDSGHGSTFFVIPRRNHPGLVLDGLAPSKRASAYGVNDIQCQIDQVMASGGEVGVHGLDAWLDPKCGCEEREQVLRVAPANEIGVRMHWLFFEEQTPARLEAAGFCYDSTFGYCETVGYRAGTMQAFKPPGVQKLLELPLHVMDTALFYPGYLNLREDQARRVVWALLDNAVKFGGVLTVNWHDRSIFPERQWDRFYGEFVRELKQRGAWLPTALQAVSWFQQRRSAVVETTMVSSSMVGIRASVKTVVSSPSLKIRIHKPRSPKIQTPPALRKPAAFVDVEADHSAEFCIAL